jgi:hypothetical protein
MMESNILAPYRFQLFFATYIKGETLWDVFTTLKGAYQTIKSHVSYFVINLTALFSLTDKVFLIYIMLNHTTKEQKHTQRQQPLN